MKQKKNKEMAVKASSRSISATEALVVHLICGLGLAVAFWVAHNVHSINLTTHPSHTLRLICVFECPIVILLYSRYRKDRERCSYLKAVGRGLLGLPAGALVNALGAIALGAPVGIQYLPKTINWSLVMSLFTVSVLLYIGVASLTIFNFYFQSILDGILPLSLSYNPVFYIICCYLALVVKSDL